MVCSFGLVCLVRILCLELYLWTLVCACTSIARSSEQTRAMVLYLYACSTCRYVRLKALNVLHVHGPRFNAPLKSGTFKDKNVCLSAQCWPALLVGICVILSTWLIYDLNHWVKYTFTLWNAFQLQLKNKLHFYKNYNHSKAKDFLQCL